MPSHADNLLGALIQQIGQEQVEHLSPYYTINRVPAQTEFIKDNHPIDALHFILQGVVSVFLESNDKILLLGRLGPGKWLGEVSLLSGQHTASSSVRTETETTLLEIKHEVFRQLMREKPELAFPIVRNLNTTLTERIRAADESIQQNVGGQFAVKGGDKIAQARATDQGWLKSLLQKLSGVEAV